MRRQLRGRRRLGGRAARGVGDRRGWAAQRGGAGGRRRRALPQRPERTRLLLRLLGGRPPGVARRRGAVARGPRARNRVPVRRRARALPPAATAIARGG